MRNIEIKAVIQDIECTISKAAELSDTVQTEIEQHDIFFNTKEGRFKLRKFKVEIVINFSINIRNNYIVLLYKTFFSCAIGWYCRVNFVQATRCSRTKAIYL